MVGKKLLKYDHLKIEKKWSKKWLSEKTYEPDLEGKAPRQARGKPFYNLMMFPYPSAEGLHVGNMYAFVGADIYGRFKLMSGFDVFEPMGLDGFGIHSENYALKVGRHPVDQAKISEKNFYRQLQSIGNGFAWDERLETYDPEYYKWTQWIFVQMFKRGLAYRKKQAVNWCPSCLTVLADEQAAQGECERCGTKVVKKELEQWFFKITEYAERLLQDLDGIDWSERIKVAQRNWIGKSEGARVKFEIRNSKFEIEVFTTRPDTIFGATYMVLSPEHEIIQKLKSEIQNREEVDNYILAARQKSEMGGVVDKADKTGVELKGIKAVNPATKKEIPIWVSDYVLSDVGTGAIMAVPAHDQRDLKFAKKYNLPVIQVVSADGKAHDLHEAYEGEGLLLNSDKFNGMKSREAKEEIAKALGAKREVRYRLRDWLISRQRYWGPPIPMIYCGPPAGGCGWQPVPEKDLPVKLPRIKNFRPTGTEKSPLAMLEKFYKTKCPKCAGVARRETDVSDTFLDSAWYYFRYPSVKFKSSSLEIRNSKLEIPWNLEVTRRWLPVDVYTGGAEHAVLHLLYTRFIAKAFYDWGLVDFDEPFKKFFAHGLIIKDGAKMSKSRGNVVVPDEYIKVYGADALRLYLMFLGPFDQGGDFRDSGINGMSRFLARVWALAISNDQFLISKQTPNLKTETQNKTEYLLHKTIKKVTGDIENFRYNTAISQLMILLRELEVNESVSREVYEIFLKLLSPFAPFMTEELWHRFGHTTSIHVQQWPRYDKAKIKEETFELVIQINGKIRDSVQASIGMVQKEAENLALSREKVKKLLGDQKPKKIIFVPKRLINIVI